MELYAIPVSSYQFSKTFDLANNYKIKHLWNYSHIKLPAFSALCNIELSYNEWNEKKKNKGLL